MELGLGQDLAGAHAAQHRTAFVENLVLRVRLTDDALLVTELLTPRRSPRKWTIRT